MALNACYVSDATQVFKLLKRISYEYRLDFWSQGLGESYCANPATFWRGRLVMVAAEKSEQFC